MTSCLCQPQRSLDRGTGLAALQICLERRNARREIGPETFKRRKQFVWINPAMEWQAIRVRDAAGPPAGAPFRPSLDEVRAAVAKMFGHSARRILGQEATTGREDLLDSEGKFFRIDEVRHSRVAVRELCRGLTR